MAHRLSRRTLLSNAGFLTAVTLAGCLDESGSGDDGTTPTGTPEDSTATDTPTETPEPKSFEEIYEEQTEAEELEDLDLGEVEDLLDSGDSKAEQIQIIITHVGKNTEEEQYASFARHAIEELGMEGVWIDERVWYGGAEVQKVTVYVEEGDGSVKKVIARRVPTNTSDPMRNSIRSGQEKPGDGLYNMWNEDSEIYVASHDFRVWYEVSEEWSEESWETLNEWNDSILIGDNREGNVVYTPAGGKYLADLEDISNTDHAKAFEAVKRINEFHHNQVPEGEYLAIHAEDGELDLHTVDEETYQEAIKLEYEP